jgi:hypothetical protein
MKDWIKKKIKGWKESRALEAEIQKKYKEEYNKARLEKCGELAKARVELEAKQRISKMINEYNKKPTAENKLGFGDYEKINLFERSF